MDKIETRKVQKVGQSTLSISLPKKWAEARDISKGTSLMVEEEENALRISPLKATEQAKRKEVILNLDHISDPYFLKRVILALYAEGAEKITLTSKERINDSDLKVIRAVQEEFVGLTIFKEAEKEVTLEVLTNPNKYSFAQLVKRIKTLIETMHREIMKGFAEGNKKLIDAALQRGMEGERIKNLMYKKVSGEQKTKHVRDNQLFVRSAELILSYEKKIGRRGLKILEMGDLKDDLLKEEVVELSDKVVEVYRTVTQELQTDILTSFQEVRTMKEWIERKEQDLLSTLPEKVENELLIPLRFILWGFRRIAEHSFAMASAKINKAIHSPEDYQSINFINEAKP